MLIDVVPNMMIQVTKINSNQRILLIRYVLYSVQVLCNYNTTRVVSGHIWLEFHVVFNVAEMIMVM